MQGTNATRGAWLVAVVGLTGCLGSPAERTCADYPRDTPGCEDYWADFDGAPPGDAALDGAPPPTDRGVGDAGPGDGPLADARADAMLDAMADDMADGMADAMADGMTDAMADGMTDAMADGMLDGALDDMGEGDGPLPDMARDCAPGEVRPCGIDVGACAPGEETCSPDGQWEPCVGAVEPAATDACDGLDDDCDGEVDEGCDCLPGDTQACGRDAGACVAGVRRCVAGVYGACEGEVAPVPEQCNGVDDDCDEVTDESFGLGDMCQVGLGACVSEGVWACAPPGAVGRVCTAEPVQGRAELCNRVDDDCDGETDEGLPPTVASHRLTGTADDEKRPALAGAGEFLAAAWIDRSDSVYIATLSGNAFEQGPVIADNYDSDNDVYAYGVALDAARGGDYVMAVSTCDVGGCGVEAMRFAGTARFGQRARFLGDASEWLSVTSNGDGAGVVWTTEAEGGRGAIGFGHVSVFGNREVEVVLDNNRVFDDQPVVAWNGETYGVAFIREGRISFRTVLPDGSATQVRQISAIAGARHPVLRWLPVHGQFLLSWVEPVGRTTVPKVAVLDALGRVVAGPFSGVADSASSPAIIPFDEAVGRAATSRVGVAWIEAAPTRRVRMSWLVHDRGVWVLRPPRDLTGGDRSLTWLLGAWGIEGAPGLLSLESDAAGRVESLTGFFGCATGPIE